MAILTKRLLVDLFFSGLQKSFNEKDSLKMSVELVRNEAYRFNSDLYYDIFLSHDFEDCRVILGLKKILTDKGYSVYIKCCDDQRKNSNYEVLDNCSSLLYVKSLSSGSFDEIPWQVDYISERGGRVSIVPILDEELSISGIETLSDFPYIDYTENSFYVHSNSSSWTGLNSWIRGSNPRKFNL